MRTIDQLIQQGCLENATKIAMQAKIRGQWKCLDYAKLWQSVEKLAAGLSEIGIKERAHVALLGPSSPRWAACYLSILRAGSVAVPVDKELKAAELRHILVDADVEAIFVGQPQFDTLLEIIDSLPQLKKVILIDIPLTDVAGHNKVAEALDKLSSRWNELVAELKMTPEQRKSIESAAIEAHALLTDQEDAPATEQKIVHLLSHAETSKHKLLKEKRLLAYKSLFHEALLPPCANKPEDTAVILYTSGTTGRSKGAMLSHRNIVSNIEAACQRFQLDDSMTTLSFLPINHVFEQVCGILLPLSLGGMVSFAESLKKLGENLNEVKPSFLLGVPAVYRLLLDRIMKNIEAKATSRLLFRYALTRRIVTAKVKHAIGDNTIFVSGGAALDPAIAIGFKDLGLTLLQGYGITETSPVISAESPFQGSPGTVGFVLDGVEVKIDTPNSDGEGEILVKGPNVMQGYYKNKRATQEVIRDGWYHTGDLGRISSDGMLSICGRVKNLIVTPNGKNVYPEEIENQLLKSPYIEEIMVYGHKISATAEEVYAVIFPNEENLFELEKSQNNGLLAAEDIEKLIRREVLTYGKELADYKRVKKFTLREDEFPKTTTRKIKRYVVEPEISTD